jgi:putative FmdB family regulatory protein
LILSRYNPIFSASGFIRGLLTVPIYEYQCEDCGHKFEVLQKIADALLTDCPTCKQPRLRKMVTAAAFRLKGGGWYETDFKDKKSQKNIQGTDSASSTGKTEGGGSTDSGSASKESAPAASPVSETKSTTTSTTKPAAD